MEYPKIETLYDRDENFKVQPGRLRLPEAGLINRWLVTEKVDGMNIRVRLAPNGDVSYFGRTDAAQLPGSLLAWLQEWLRADRLKAVFDPNTLVFLFGEGYGPKIQSGGGYRKDMSFRLFDVVVYDTDGRPWWLNWENVAGIALKLGIAPVPVLASGVPLSEAVSLVDRGSYVAFEDGGDGCPQEGIVARTEPLLFTRRGHRLVWKLKRKDF